MVGTRAGGLKAAKTNKERNGEDFFSRIGKKGGQNGHTGGFASSHERAVEAGRKGGKISKRGPAKETTKKATKTTPKFKTAKPVINPEPQKAKPGIFKRLFGGK